MIDIMQRDGIVAHAKEMGARWMADLRGIESDRIADVRGYGLMIGVEMDSAETAKAFQAYCLENGVLINVAHGKTVVVLGWKELYQSDADDEDEKGELPPVRKGDGVQFRSGKVEEKATKAPPRFTSSTLLQAMKEIYKYVKDDSLKKKLKCLKSAKE